MTSNTALAKARTSCLAQIGPIPRIVPDPRYFSIPSIVVGTVALRNAALNWTTVHAVADPGSGRLGELAGRDHGRVAENRYQVTLAAGFDPQREEPVLCVVKGDALYQSGQNLGRRARPGYLAIGS
jgi:hypothetical protein